MKSLAFFGVLSFALALPTASTLGGGDNAPAIIGRDLESPVTRNTNHSPDRSSVLLARAFYDQAFDWPAESFAHGTRSFQFQVVNLGNGRYRLNWWNTDPANSPRKIKLTFNAGGGSRLFEIVTSAQTRGNTEITQRDSSFRAILDDA
ncbi:hypothetical protein HJFPF1_07512 [Paramyrothecium foliicola]|nr:hypothetical protein HJFPF1_07512 [Paramyrothecium foliicola]